MEKGNFFERFSVSVPLHLFIFLTLFTLAPNLLAKHVKKSVTYLKIKIPSDAVRYAVSRARFLAGFDIEGFLESEIRRAVEIPRFEYNPVNVPPDVPPDELAKAVKDYIDKVKIKRAKKYAEYSWEYKQYIITADILETIVNSAYIYRPEITKFSVRYIVEIHGRRHIREFVTVTLGVRVRWWKVDYRSARAIKVADVSAEHSETVEVGKIDLGLPFPLSLFSPGIPVLETPLDAFRRCTRKTIKWIAKKINAQIRKIPEFKLTATVQTKNFWSVWFPLSARDGIYKDLDFEVIRVYENGKEERVGWVRVRSVGDGITTPLSRAQIIVGKAEIGDTVREYPLVGVMFSPSVAYGGELMYRVFALAEGKQSAFFVSFGGKLNLAQAYRLGISELYLGAKGFLVFSGALEVGAGVSLSKKFFVRMLWAEPYVFGTVQRVFVPTPFGSARTWAFGVEPGARIGIFFSPRFSLGVGAFTREIFSGGIFSLEGEIVEGGLSFRGFALELFADITLF